MEDKFTYGYSYYYIIIIHFSYSYICIIDDEPDFFFLKKGKRQKWREQMMPQFNRMRAAKIYVLTN